ncbi:MAG: VanZ family protein [Bacillota bacterium]|jgi:glycopeptide antibiotics resistance protein
MNLLRQGSKQQQITWVLFIIYMTILTWVILFKFQLPFTFVEHVRSVNMLPYSQSLVTNGRVNFFELVMNAVVFVPLGVYAGLLFRKWSWGKKSLLFAGVSFAFELLQFIFAMGRSDITDIINNFLGAVIGVLLYLLLGQLCKTKERTNRVVNILAIIITVLLLSNFAIMTFYNA